MTIVVILDCLGPKVVVKWNTLYSDWVGLADWCASDSFSQKSKTHSEVVVSFE